jgi:class 3 adenylate cyclase
MRKTAAMEAAQIRYAEHNGDYLAYSVFGSGNHDVAVLQSRTPIDLMWELPQLAEFMEALGRLARVIVWDGRGAGASDPMEAGKSSIESTADDIATVLDAAAAERVTLLDLSNGGSTMYAATYPERVRSLILVNLRASHPELDHLTIAQRKRLAIKLKSADFLRIENPRVAHDPVLRRWWERAGRLLNSPEALARHLEDAAGVNYEPFFPGLQHPALVLHRRDNRIWDIESSRAAAAMIPGARFVELPGAENDIFLGDTAPVLAEIEQFLSEPEIDIASDRPLATVLFTDIVSSTEQLAERGDDAWRRILDVHEATMDRIVTAHRGRVVRHTGDGLLATFDGPARAVHCAAAMLYAAQEVGVTLRAGLHTGEIELRPPDIAGIAVHIASRVADLAGPLEIIVSRTVVDLTAGSGLVFEPRGEHELKGVPGTWPTFAAQTGS